MKKIKIYSQFDNDEPEIRFIAERERDEIKAKFITNIDSENDNGKNSKLPETPLHIINNSDDFTLHFRGEAEIIFESKEGKKFKLFSKIEQ